MHALQIAVTSAALAFGIDTQSQAPTLPAPRVVEEIALPAYPGYYRESRYAVWDNYAVDRTGQFKPVVNNAPCGQAYYRYNGQPYPYVPIAPRAIWPRTAD